MLFCFHCLVWWRADLVLHWGLLHAREPPVELHLLWGWSDHAYALIVLQLCLAALNIRGACKNDPALADKLDPS